MTWEKKKKTPFNVPLKLCDCGSKGCLVHPFPEILCSAYASIFNPFCAEFD